MTSIVLTYAEVAFLLDERAHVCERLGISESEVTADIVSAGAASLLARGLLRELDGRLAVDEELAALAVTLDSATGWVEIGFAREESSGGVQVFDAPAARLQVAAGLLGTFTFAPLDASEPLSEAVGDFVSRLLAVDGPAAVFVKATPRVEVAPDAAFAVRTLEPGSVEVAVGSGEAVVETMSLEDALTRLRRYVEPAEPSTAPAPA